MALRRSRNFNPWQKNIGFGVRWISMDIRWRPLCKAAEARRRLSRFMHKLMKQCSIPRVIITDKLRSYGAAKRALAPGLVLNNAAEVSHKPARRRERVMGRFKSPAHAQQFLPTHDQINVLFRPRRHQLSAVSYRHARSDAFAVWHDITCEIAAA